MADAETEADNFEPRHFVDLRFLGWPLNLQATTKNYVIMSALGLDTCTCAPESTKGYVNIRISWLAVKLSEFPDCSFDPSAISFSFDLLGQQVMPKVTSNLRVSCQPLFR